MKIIRKIFIFPFIVLIKLYQYLISPWFPLSCRHNPSCSNYSLEAFKKHGLLKGFYLSFRRIIRCNPWGTYGNDPVP